MAKFYVNSLESRSIKHMGQRIIGLFKQCRAEGRGNFCGYYASEYYLNTELYAYYEAELGVYRPEARVSKLTICDPAIKFDEVQIGSDMWTLVIEAETVDEAIELFANAAWRKWTLEDEVLE